MVVQAHVGGQRRALVDANLPGVRGVIQYDERIEGRGPAGSVDRTRWRICPPPAVGGIDGAAQVLQIAARGSGGVPGDAAEVDADRSRPYSAGRDAAAGPGGLIVDDGHFG